MQEPFAIQTRVLPSALAGRDVLARAVTGSGKTLAFGLPMLASIAAQDARGGARTPRGLVLAPTRELARQIAEALEPVATGLGLRVAAVYGGAPISRQIDRFRQGIDVLIATPGRLLDLMERGVAVLDGITVAVIDEADHMADMGFLPDVTQIFDATPPGRQCMLFSATLDRRVHRLAARYLRDPAIHAVAPQGADASAMEHRVFALSSADKVEVAAEIAHRPARTLFFVRTKRGADRLATDLRHRGVEAAAIHGNLNQNQRLRVLDGFSSGHTRVMVATDVAARGLDISDVDLVVHYDPPKDHKDYLHRSGRTARAGATGTVLSLVEDGQGREVARIHASASISAEHSRVTGGHPAVRAMAESGLPITLLTAAPKASRPGSGNARPARNGPRRPTRTAPAGSVRRTGTQSGGQ